MSQCTLTCHLTFLSRFFTGVHRYPRGLSQYIFIRKEVRFTMFDIGKVKNILTCKHGKGQFVCYKSGDGDKETIHMGYNTPLVVRRLKKELNLTIVKRAAQAYQVGHMRPQGRVLDTPGYYQRQLADVQSPAKN